MIWWRIPVQGNPDPKILYPNSPVIIRPAVSWQQLALAILPPLVRLMFMGLDPQWGDWVYRALTFLVISCPCALVISIPLSFLQESAERNAPKNGVKGSNYMETLAQTRYVVFDKTGTLTKGVCLRSAVCITM